MARASTVNGLVSSLAALGLLLTVSSSADAVRPTDSRVELIPKGTEWILGHSGDLSRGSVGPPPAEFAARNGDGLWRQRLSGPHGGFRRIWGEGLAVDPAVTDDPQVALAVAEQFWRDNEYLLPAGVTADQLVPTSNSSLGGVRIVAHRQTADGVPVLGCGNYLAFLSGRLVLIGAHNLPLRDFDAAPAVGAADAVAAAVSLLAAHGVHAEPGAVELVALPVVGDDALSIELVWAVELRAPFGRWTAYVDASSGEGFALRDERVFLEANLELNVHPRHAANALSGEPAAHLHLTTGSEDVTTDAEGAFSATGDPLDIEVSLLGLYADVNNTAGEDMLLETTIGDGETYLWTDEAEFQQAQLDAYVSMNVIRDYIRALVDDLEWLDSQQIINANVYDMDGDDAPDYCNAWTDFETLNFLRAGESWAYCYNTASNSDIVMHEWGHVFHGISAWSLGVGMIDEAVSEGFADTAAVTISHDSTVAPFFTEEGYSIRNLEPDKVWPYDQDPDPHQTGLILGGALWDLRKILVADHGSSTGHSMLDDIFVQTVRTTSTIPSLWEATLLADDDNGNLMDGTPNFCSIYAAYNLHGLISGAFGRVMIDHEPIYQLLDPSPPISVDADVYVVEEDCNTLGEVRVIYSTDLGDSWNELPMENQGGNAYHAEIPAQPMGSEVYYRIEADEEDSDDVIAKPNNAAEPYYKIYIGPLVEIFCDDFEAGDGGWTHQLVWGDDIEGADDWMWGTPKGLGGDPDGCYSGEYCWGNDLTPEDNWNGMYQNSRCNRATSPPFDLSEYDHVRLRFRRWLNVEDGFNDLARIYVGNEVVWQNYASPGSVDDMHDVHHEDLEWILFDLDVSEWAAGQAEVQFAFEIQTNAEMMFGGWTFDDFCLYTRDPLPEGDPDGGIGDDAGPGATTTMAASGSGCDCDAAGARSDASPGLLGLILSTL